MSYELSFIINRKNASKSSHWVREFETLDELNALLNRLIEQAKKDKDIVEKKIDPKLSEYEKMSALIMSQSPAIGYSYEITKITRETINDEYVEF